MKISDLHIKYKQSSGVSIDSRSISKGQMFFALKGPNFDGHQYITKALASGASYAIIDDEKYIENPHTILVSNVEKALQDLARYHRSSLTISIIGLTGSNGKTTTKELLASILNQKYNVFATKGNLNNHLGVPLSILSISNKHNIAIIEMGANHLGEIKFLSEICMPNYGLITNIGKAHLEGFGSIEGVKKAKTELFDYLRKVEGLIFFNSSDEKLQESISIEDNVISYKSSEIKIENSFPHLTIEYKRCKYSVNLSGEYNATNMVAAITIGEHFGLETAQIKKGLIEYTPSNNRSEIRQTEKNILILDAYNANPSSMKVSVDNINRADAKNKTLIIGHMLELGESSIEEHKDLIDYITKLRFENVFLIGTEFKYIKIPDHFYYFDDTSTFEKHLIQQPIEDNTILLKGSRGIALEKLIPYL